MPVVWQVISWILMAFLCLLSLSRLRQDRLAMAGFVFKLAMGIALGLIYQYAYHGGDTWAYFHEAEDIAKYSMSHPEQWRQIYFQTLQLPELSAVLVFTDQPRALFYAKIVSVMYWLGGGSYWLISIILSLIGFWTAYGLVREIALKNAQISMEAKLAFYFLPSFVFWSAGLLKESLAIATLLWMVSMVLRMGRTGNVRNTLRWIGCVCAGGLLWKLKYYYAAVAIPILTVLLIGDLAWGRYRKYKWYLPVLLLAVVIAMSFSHYNLHPSRILDVVYQNYQLMQHTSANTIHFYHFDGGVLGFVINAPVALAAGLFYPLIPKLGNWLLSAVAMENMAIFVVFIYAIWPTKLRLPKPDGYTIAALAFVCILAIMMAFAMPNLGTLSRYKAVYWPFFVLLLLVAARQKKRPETSRSRPHLFHN